MAKQKNYLIANLFIKATSLEETLDKAACIMSMNRGGLIVPEAAINSLAEDVLVWAPSILTEHLKRRLPQLIKNYEQRRAKASQGG